MIWGKLIRFRPGAPWLADANEIVSDRFESVDGLPAQH
jgi:hypothetical protein